MKNAESTESFQHDKSGIALVMVLGMLAVLMLMAVAFSTLMRTGLAGARASARTDYTRDLALSVLDYVLIDIDGDLLDDRVGLPAGVRGEFFFTNVDNTGETTEFTLVNDKALGSFYDLVGISPDPQLFWHKLPSNDMTDVIGDIQFAYIIIPETDHIDVNDWKIKQNFHGAAINYSQWYDWMTNRYKLFTTPELPEDFVEGRASAHYTVFSRFTQSYIENLASVTAGEYDGDRAWIGGTAAEIGASQTNVTQQLGAAGIADPAFVQESLLDYVEPGTESRHGLDGFNTIPVPLFNEVAVTGRVEFVDPTYNVYADVLVEVWNPYDKTNTSTYTISHDFDFSNLGAVPFAEVQQLGTTIPQMEPLEFMVFTSRWEATNLDAVDLGNFTVEIRQLEHPGDRVAAAFPVFNLTAAANGSFSRSYQVNDPRRNYDATEWRQAPLTIGDSNNVAAFFGYQPWQLPLHNAGTNLKHVGELCFVPAADANWSFIDTLGAHSAVLDYFTAYSNRHVHGLVNINSRRARVLQAGIYNTNVNFVLPDGFTDAQALAFANALIGEANGQPFYRRSQIAPLVPGANPRILAACSDHLDLYGNSFTIMLMTRIGNSRPYPDETDFNYSFLSEFASDIRHENDRLVDPWGQAYRYELSPDGLFFEIRSAGRDRLFDTADDIVVTR